MSWNENGFNFKQYGHSGPSSRRNDGVAFMVPHADKDGQVYYKGYADLGGGKGLRLLMFPNTKEGLKSEFVVKMYKKKYNPNKSNQTKW